MTPEQFCYWLQGFAELNVQPPTTEQWVAVMAHLQTVFRKVTPPLTINELIDRATAARPEPAPTKIIC